MIDDVTLDVAQRLFPEARDFASGRTPYLAVESEIREIALKTFGQAYVMHIMAVMNEIFYVLACEFQDVPR